MEPLFLAVICGCNAGLFREALREVYIPRIQRGNVAFAVLPQNGPAFFLALPGSSEAPLATLVAHRCKTTPYSIIYPFGPCMLPRWRSFCFPSSSDTSWGDEEFGELNPRRSPRWVKWLAPLSAC